MNQAMVSSSCCSSLFGPRFRIPPAATTVIEIPRNRLNKIKIEFCTRPTPFLTYNPLSTAATSSLSTPLLHKYVPLAVSLAILLWSTPAEAGFLSGFSGIESIPGPQLPQIDFLSRFNEENQKKYAEFDERFKSSPLLKQLLERSKLNKEKNRQEILDKYCIRGAEWGVGDCSAESMTPEEKDKFITMLKQKAGEK